MAWRLLLEDKLNPNVARYVYAKPIAVERKSNIRGAVGWRRGEAGRGCAANAASREGSEPLHSQSLSLNVR